MVGMGEDHVGHNLLVTTETCGYAAFFCLIFAHLARWNAAIFLRAAADIVRFGFTAFTPFDDAGFAHRAFCAMLIFLRVAHFPNKRLLNRFTCRALRQLTVPAIP
jgi:hypothetical protein